MHLTFNSPSGLVFLKSIWVRFLGGSASSSDFDKFKTESYTECTHTTLTFHSTWPNCPSLHAEATQTAGHITVDFAPSVLSLPSCPDKEPTLICTKPAPTQSDWLSECALNVIIRNLGLYSSMWLHVWIGSLSAKGYKMHLTHTVSYDYGRNPCPQRAGIISDVAQ